MVMKANSIFNAIRQGLLICNSQGQIVFFNQIYGEFIGVRLQDVRGQLITDIRPGSRIPEVLKYHRPIENILRNENGQEYFASIYPLIETGSPGLEEHISIRYYMCCKETLQVNTQKPLN